MQRERKIKKKRKNTSGSITTISAQSGPLPCLLGACLRPLQRTDSLALRASLLTCSSSRLIHYRWPLRVSSLAFNKLARSQLDHAGITGNLLQKSQLTSLVYEAARSQGSPLLGHRTTTFMRENNGKVLEPQGESRIVVGEPCRCMCPNSGERLRRIVVPKEGISTVVIEGMSLEPGEFLTGDGSTTVEPLVPQTSSPSPPTRVNLPL